MAFTVSTVFQGVVFGNKLTKVLRVTADAAEANLTTGLNTVEMAFCQVEKGQTMPAAHINKNSSGTVAAGVLGVSGTSNANIFNVLVLGS